MHELLVFLSLAHFNIFIFFRFRYLGGQGFY